ncbi:Gfo/Idh/MocA family oxidoreductase [Glycomyces sp. A-F 0318]|uniref:Gfo/Idh/MocA family protein n=1 Tax=Glycomyces amatae TaxID=2881355 RepID=UPI001E4A9D0A|nr:Gfo/Idh/MocA family oxidoreductase [Glycomyces amatae]MCD0443359.1 Gfo/Idh/MocA family oxidoreductase [Glycomyces amatae]
MSFRTIAGDGPLRLVVVGAGGMGRAWARTVRDAEDTELVGIADLSSAAAEAAAEEVGAPGLALGADAVELARRTGADAIVNVTVPEAHHPVTTAALLAGLPVLGEKPVAASVAEGLSLAAAAEHTGQLFMVSQSRRYHRSLHQAKRRLAGLGAVGIVAVDFFKAPRFGGFRDEMASPLLLDMAIHQFDMARFLLDADPVSVSCEEYNPAWSWYAGDAAATAVFAMEGGARFVFNGSWCSPGFETSWNGSWRISAERGTVLWDGEGEPGADPDEAAEPADDPGREIAGSLREFVAALRRGREPMGRVHANVMSLAMVEAATQSASQGRRVAVDDVLDRSYDAALATERDADVRAVMKAWPSVRDALSLKKEPQ